MTKGTAWITFRASFFTSSSHSSDYLPYFFAGLSFCVFLIRDMLLPWTFLLRCANKIVSSPLLSQVQSHWSERAKLRSENWGTPPTWVQCAFRPQFLASYKIPTEEYRRIADDMYTASLHSVSSAQVVKPHRQPNTHSSIVERKVTHQNTKLSTNT